MLPYLSALENATVFKGALQMSRFTLLFLLYFSAYYDTKLPLSLRADNAEGLAVLAA